MTKGSANAELVPASDGESGRSARLANAMAELEDEGPVVDRVRNRGTQQPGVGREGRGFTHDHNVTEGLRGNDAKWALRCGTGFLPVVVSRWRVGRLIGSKTTEDKFRPVRHPY